MTLIDLDFTTVLLIVAFGALSMVCLKGAEAHSAYRAKQRSAALLIAIEKQPKRMRGEESEDHG